MEIAGLLGDAFQADELKSRKQFGLSLQGKHEDVKYNINFETSPIDPKFDTVCLMKAEVRKYRNMIAVSENYICYIVKGHLLRVLDSATGEKALLRGHESPILDVRFSSSDPGIVCSVDGGDGNVNHLHIWRINSDEVRIDQNLLYSAPLKANNVKSHPKSSRCWAISFANQFGLVHTELDTEAKSYHNLKFRLSFKDEVIDFCFSPDCSYVAVITGTLSNNSVGIFRLNNARDEEELMGGQYGMVPYSTITQSEGNPVSGMSFLTTDELSDCILVTLSSTCLPSSSSCISNVNVWNFSGGKRNLNQSLSITMPRSPQTQAQMQPHDFPLSTLAIDTLQQEYLCISSRDTAIVPCLGICDDPRRRLYHCTFFNLKFPLSSVVTSTVNMKEKDEAGRGLEAHVGITCFQDQQNGQQAVQQYHVPSRWAFKPPSSHLLMSRGEEFNQGFSSSMMQDILFSSEESRNSPVAQDSNYYSHQSGISILTKDDDASSLPVGSFPDFALINPPSSKNISELPSEQVDIGVKSKQILLNALKVKSTSTPPAFPNVPSSGGKSNSAMTQPTSAPITMSKLTSISVTQKNETENENADDEEDEWEKASISITRSQPGTPVTSDVSANVNGSLEPKLNSLLALSNRIEEKIVSAERQRIRKAKAIEASIPKSLSEMKAGVVQEVIEGIEQIQSKSLSALIEKQCQESLTNVLTSEKWRQQLSAQVSADLRRELTPVVSQTIRFCVKDNIKECLGDALRTCFESTIVPAYEAGSREMFSQLEKAFVDGVEVIKSDSRSIIANNRNQNEALKSEISVLRETVSRLESKISEMGILGGGNAIPKPESSSDTTNIYETDFKLLYHQGRVGESLEMALELKDVNCVLWVLEQQSKAPSGLGELLEKSDALSILCTVQQLAADLAINEPEEGIRSRMDVLKEMIMYMIDDHFPASDVSCIVTSILNYLKSVEAKHTLVGSSRTDMKMICSILSSNF